MLFSVIFCFQICLIQYTFSQRINGAAVANNGFRLGPTGLNQAIQGQTVGRKVSELSAITGSGFTSINSNPALGQFGVPSSYGAGRVNVGYANGNPNPIHNTAGIQNPAYSSPGMPNPVNGGAGFSNAQYGGVGNGEVMVTGELPLFGTTAVTGHVPLSGKVTFNGNVPAGGSVTISGTCSCGSSDGSYGQVPSFGIKPYRY